MKAGLIPYLILMVVLLGLLSGLMTANRDSQAAASSDATRGEVLFRKGMNEAPPCITCHALSEGVYSLGPVLAGVRERAGNRVEGLSEADYLRQSIVEPTAFIVGGYRPIMFPAYAEHLSEQDLRDVIAFLLTL
ncbi:MAG TPA: cytochrome c [Aggregatilineales bacterium]|nr:cytochrome c [Aggregatilineales bacterium]